MKQLTLTAGILLMAISVFGQGTVLFQHNASTLVCLYGTPVPAGTTFSINLYYAVDSATAPADSGFSAFGNPVNFIAPGRFNGGIRTTPSTTRPGEAAWFHVRVWETAFGNSYEAAVAAGAVRIATSCKFNLVVGAPIGVPTPITSPGGFTGMMLLSVPCIPEPSVTALSILGLVGLLMLRCRRSSADSLSARR